MMRLTAAYLWRLDSIASFGYFKKSIETLFTANAKQNFPLFERSIEKTKLLKFRKRITAAVL